MVNVNEMNLTKKKNALILTKKKKSNKLLQMCWVTETYIHVAIMLFKNTFPFLIYCLNK